MTWSEPIRSPRIGIAVVAFNATATLEQTLRRIPAAFMSRVSEVIVLDDASHDDTHSVALGWASARRDVTSVVVRHTKNLGYGGNQKAAYALASERGLDVVVLLHGDGQYDPDYLGAIVDPIVAGDADAVFGSRMMVPGAARQGGMPAYKRLGNRILTTIENRLLHTSLSEFHSGYRAYRVGALDRLPLEFNSDGFDFDTQIIVQLLDQGMRIVETPIPTYYGDEICYVNGTRYAWDVVRDVLEYRAARVGFGSPSWVPTPTEYQVKEAEGSSHDLVIELLRHRAPARVLDLGCSGGLLAAELRAAGHHVTGVDVVEVLGVRDRTDAFHLVDLDQGLPADLDGDFDVVVAADVVEHLARPERLMRDVRRVLAPGGELIVSVPNVGHWYPRSRVALGQFGYDRRGPLDNTHLRFFSRRSLRRFVRDCGFDVTNEQGTGLPFGPVSGSRADRALVRMRPELFAYQFVLRLVPHAASAEIQVFETDPQLVEVGSTPQPRTA